MVVMRGMTLLWLRRNNSCRGGGTHAGDEKFVVPRSFSFRTLTRRGRQYSVATHRTVLYCDALVNQHASQDASSLSPMRIADRASSPAGSISYTSEFHAS